MPNPHSQLSGPVVERLPMRTRLGGCGFDPGQVTLKTLKMVHIAFLLGTCGVRSPNDSRARRRCCSHVEDKVRIFRDVTISRTLTVTVTHGVGVHCFSFMVGQSVFETVWKSPWPHSAPPEFRPLQTPRQGPILQCHWPERPSRTQHTVGLTTSVNQLVGGSLFTAGTNLHMDGT